MSETVREMTFEEEAALYEKEARAEFAKETDGADCSAVNGILRRGMRIIRKAREEMEWIRARMRPITYGTWVIMPCGPVAVYGCSHCGREIPFGCHPEDLSFCPYCGEEKDGTSSKLGLPGEREFKIYIREGITLQGERSSTIGIRYFHKGEVYGTYVDFKKAKLGEDDIAEACKELAYSYTMALESLEAEADS